MTNYEQWQIDRYGNILGKNGKVVSAGINQEPVPSRTYLSRHNEASKYLFLMCMAEKSESMKAYREFAMRYCELMSELTWDILNRIR